MARIGVSGVGSIGLRHARLLDGLGVDVLLHDARPGGIEVPEGLASRARWLDSFDELLAQDLDGLVVATPDHAHVEQVAAACMRNVPVLVEKPVADSLSAARTLEPVLRASGTPVLVGYVLRHVGVVRRARELVAAGAVGTIVSVAATLGAYETLEVARNRFDDDTRFRILVDYSHEWDYLRWIVGPIERVVAAGRLAGDRPLRQDPNVVDGVVEFVDGATGTFHLDYIRTPGTRAFTVIGDRATLDADVGGGRLTLRAYEGSDPVVEDLREPRDASFERQLRHFLAVATEGERPEVGLDDGLRALAVAEAVECSCTGGTWVEICR